MMMVGAVESWHIFRLLARDCIIFKGVNVNVITIEDIRNCSEGKTVS